jgi:predicted phosphodiesterase
MKICVLSDLHVDSGSDPFPLPEADVLIVAGDTANNPQTAMTVINQLSRHFKHTIVVDGNHEHYSNAYDGASVSQTLFDMNALAFPDVHVLTPGHFDIDGIHLMLEEEIRLLIVVCGSVL